MAYAWEGQLQRSWDALVEDEHGVLRVSGAARGDGAARGRARGATGGAAEISGPVCRNMIRYVCLVVDLSRAMAETDIRPSRRIAAIEVATDFVGAFLDENPLSSVSVLQCVDGRCARVSEMSGSSKAQLASLQLLPAEAGEFSLQNSLEVAKAVLHNVPQHGSKEVLVLMGSLSTCDAGDIFETMDEVRAAGIRCSVVGLGSAEVYVTKKLSQETKGTYGVAVSRAHLRQLVLAHVPPPPVLTETRNGLRCSFVRMGFPSQGRSREEGGGGTRQSLSATGMQLTSQGFICPRCASVVEDLPCACPICGLELIASSHLARSYHHLFPVQRFKPVKLADCIHASCSACDAAFSSPAHAFQSYFQCPTCATFLCERCEVFVHESLHNCPACLIKDKQRDAEKAELYKDL